jgi:serine/threonine protein kinase/Tol biopolymer transport system component
MQTDALERVTRTLADRYHVERLIGEGGMATVYLARDLKHDRDVALKILNPELGAVLGTDRFLAEIRVTARLQHPNLLPLFDSGDAEGILYYVMPFVEGESLRSRLERERQLPLDETIHIAAAVANGLDYAHDHSIIHRDLKPENILLQSGEPLIADFGIALAVTVAGGQRVTQTGLSLGTPQYMSPEQATGDRQIDRRTDIYSLGAVVYEMLTGEPPHTGGTVQAIVAKVLTERPRRVRLVRPSVPEHVEQAIDCALEKVPADRWQTAGDFADALRGRPRIPPPTTRSYTEAESQPPARTIGSRLRDPIVVAALALAVAASGFAAWSFMRSEREPSSKPVRFMFGPPDEIASVIGTLDISPDGRTIAYLARVEGTKVGLALRSLDSLAPRLLPGVIAPLSPTFSPDGRWIAFLSGSALQKISVDGGPVIPLAEWTRPRISLYSIRWSDDGILVGSERGLFLVPPGGGEPRLFAPIDSARGEIFRGSPLQIPGTHAVLFASGRAATATHLSVTMLPSGKTKDLGILALWVVGVEAGHLLYVENEVLMAVPFDSNKLETTGTPMPVLDRVYGLGQIALASNGTLVYRMGSFTNQPSLISRDTVQPLLPVGRYWHTAYSPDGRRIALSFIEGDRIDVGVYDVAARSLTRLTTDGEGNDRPEWTPDGTRIIYRSTRQGKEALWWQPVDGSAPAEILLERPGGVQEGAITPDGTTLIYRTIRPITGRDILARSLSGDTTSRLIVATNAGESHIAVSPDGKFLAYQSNESGRVEVFVRSLEGTGARWQVTSDGGSSPVWSRDGRKLFYFNGRAIAFARISADGGFTVVSRDTLATGSYFRSNSHRSFDVAPDGNHVLAFVFSGGDVLPVVVLNWVSELRQKLAR